MAYFKEDHGQLEPPELPMGVIALADGIKDNGAMKKLTISGDKHWSKPVTIETSMTEAAFSGKGLGVSGAMMLAAFLPKCR